MNTYLDCIQCLVAHALDASRMVSRDEKLHRAVIYEVVRKLAGLDYSLARH